MPDERWIVVRNWDRFQHYGTVRTPPWIRVYTELLHNEDYLTLTGHQRAVLHGLWLAYASARCQLAVSTSSLTRQLGLRVSSRQLEALNHAGFIHFSASKPLAQDFSRGEERREEPPKPPVTGGPQKLTAKELRQFTGCKYVRGSHGATWVPDPLGRDKPPPDWPYPKPEPDEIKLHLEIHDR